MGIIFCIFGDSIVYGNWDPEGGGWVSRLRKFLDQKTASNSDDYFAVYNLGVSGETTPDLLKRFNIECEARLLGLEDNESAVIIFAIGINDSQFIHSENNLRTPPEDFKENLRNLVKLAQKITPRIIFAGLTPVDETKTTPTLWNTDKSYLNENIKKYNEVLKLVCKENNLLFIEIFEKLIEWNYKELLEDGLHPNAGGHQKIFGIVKDFLIKSKII